LARNIITKIPLVTETDLSMYYALSVPIRVLEINQFLIIKPENPYIAITKDRKRYTTFSDTQKSKCTDIYTISVASQPLQENEGEQLCEIELFNRPTEPPATCKPHAITLHRSIFHKLRYRNEWIYAVTNDTLRILCPKMEESIIERLSGTGTINIKNTQCEVLAQQAILEPIDE